MMSNEVQPVATETPNATAEQPAAVVNPPAVEPSKEAAPAPQAPAVPEKYELTLEEGSRLDPGYIEQFSAFAKEKNMTQEQAKEIFKREEAAVNGFYEKQAKLFEQTKESWKKAAEADPEIGGERFRENVALAHNALKKFASEKFIQDLDSSGYGNHPELVRIFAKIGKAMGDSKIQVPGAQSGGPRSPEDILYGGSSKR